MTTVEIICFGNELLIGKTVNTNATWLGKRITSLGGFVTRITAIHDTMDEMKGILLEAISRKPDMIITTGGLGTTFDDMAIGAVAKAIGKELVLNEIALELIKERIVFLQQTRGVSLDLNEDRKRMAYMPKGATALKNRSGSAPGCLVEKNGIKIFSVPGVPREMEAIFDYEIIKFFDNDPNKQYYENSLIVNHIPESELATAISPVREKYPFVYMKTHPHSTSATGSGLIEVEIHFSSICSKEESINIEKAQEEVYKILENMKGLKGEVPIIKKKYNEVDNHS